MPQIVARFYVTSFNKKAGDVAEVSLSPVHSKENARWSQYTPSGEIKMNLTRKASGARSTFEEMIGRECLVTFDFDGIPEKESPESAPGGGYVSDEAETEA